MEVFGGTGVVLQGEVEKGWKALWKAVFRAVLHIQPMKDKHASFGPESLDFEVPTFASLGSNGLWKCSFFKRYLAFLAQP